MKNSFVEFIKYEGEIYKIEEAESGFEPYKLINNSWEAVDELLTVNLLSYGLPVDDSFMVNI
ncbi:MAG: hypothetical protein ACQEQC_08270 [Elusimicrobiota bacterium]